MGIAIDSRTVQLSWNSPDIEDHNGVIRRYIINITEVETGQLIQRNVTTTSVTIADLHPFYSYVWTVSAVTVGEGPYSPYLVVTTPEDGKLYINFMPRM